MMQLVERRGRETPLQASNCTHAGSASSLVALLRDNGYTVTDDDALEGFFRVYVSAPFGNRIELMEPLK
jgi:hypothetical protein